MAKEEEKQPSYSGRRYTPDVIGSLGRGMSMGRQLAGRENQRLLGGLKRKMLGLDTNDKEEQERAALEYLAIDEEGAKKIWETYEKMDPPAQRKERALNESIAKTGAYLLGLDDQLLADGINASAQDAIRNGNMELAQGLMQLYRVALTDPEFAKMQIEARVSQAREVEDIYDNMMEQNRWLAESEISNKDKLYEKIDKLRARVTTASTGFNERRDSLNGLRSSYDLAKKTQTYEQNNASQIAMVFQFMKILDPRSVVREGEFQTVQKTDSIPNYVWLMWEKAESGTLLSDDQMDNMMQEAEAAFTKHKVQHERKLEKYKKTAEKFDLPWDQIADANYDAVSFPKASKTAEETLRANPSPVNRASFKNKFGYLPKGMPQR